MTADANRTPDDFPTAPPTDLAASTVHTRQLVRALEENLKELKEDVKVIKGHSHTDFRWIITVFGAGFLILAGMTVTGYFRLDDKIGTLVNETIRVDTKLEDLLQRIPIIQTPVIPTQTPKQP